MLKISNDEDSHIISTEVSKEFSPRDWERLVPALTRKSLHHENVGWCLELRDFDLEARDSGLEGNSLGQFNSNSISRIAIVADGSLRKWAEEVVSPFSSAEIQYFDLLEKPKALVWLES